MKLQKIEPYSDADMGYDPDAEMYVLTFEWAKANLPNTFKDDDVLKKRLVKNSQKVYRALRYRGFSANWRYALPIANKTEEGRNYIFDLLRAQMEADAESGFNDLTLTPAINVSNGQIIDRELLFANDLSVDAEIIMDSSQGYFGFPLPCRTAYPYGLILNLKGVL